MIYRSSSRPRAGFTLIELLVTMSILVILIGLTTSAVMKFRDMGPTVATRSNLNDIKSKVNAQWKAVRDKALRESMSPYKTTVQTVAGVNNLVDPQARITFVQLRLAQAFPQSFNEILTPGASQLPAWSGYTTYLNSLGVTTANASSVPANAQAAICLMMALERGPFNPGGVTPESLGTTATRSYPAGTGNAFGVADAFGDPLTFSRGPNAAVITSTHLLSTDDANQ